jgi:hypothetical protein
MPLSDKELKSLGYMSDEEALRQPAGFTYTGRGGKTLRINSSGDIEDVIRPDNTAEALHAKAKAQRAMVAQKLAEENPGDVHEQTETAPEESRELQRVRVALANARGGGRPQSEIRALEQAVRDAGGQP